MKKLNLLTIVFLVLCLTSCSSPLDKEFNKATMKEDIAEMKSSGAITDDEEVLINFQIEMNEFDGKSSEGKTYYQLLYESDDDTSD